MIAFARKSKYPIETMSRIVGLLCLAVSLWSQTISGTLEGYVKDPSGASVPGASITVKNVDTGLTRKTVTNEQGYYQHTFLPLGEYEVLTEAAGFGAVQRKQTVELNAARAVDFELKPSNVSTEVTVVADTTLIETTRGEIRASLDERQIEDRPLPSRNMLSLVEQLPGFQSTGGYSAVNNPTLSSGSYVSFGGTGSRSASFQIDGVNNDDSSEGTSRQNVNVSAIKEFAVLQNAYSAEFGRAGGAIVLVQTKSGTNAFHGDLYEYLQNEKLNSNSFFNNSIGRDASNNLVAPRAPYRRNQYGWTIGGPIFRNKLFFFHSFEQTKLRQYTTVRRFLMPITQVTVGDCRLCLKPEEHPNLEADRKFLQGILDRFPKVEPNATAICSRCFVETRPSSFPDEDYSGKLDWNPGQRDTANVRYQYSRQKRFPGELIPGETARQNNKQANIGLNHTHMFSASTWGEFRFGLGLRTTLVDISDGNATPILRIANTSPYSTTLLGSAQQFPINRWQTDYQYNYTLSHVRGRHILKTGVDYRRQRLDDVADNAGRGFWNFTASGLLGAPDRYEGWENFLRGFIRSYQKGYGNFFTENRAQEFNGFILDDFKLKPNFTLNFGLRYEFVKAPVEAKDRITYGYSSYGAIQPRFGFAWSPGSQKGKTSIRGGFGMFNNRIFTSIFSQGGASLRSLPPYGVFRSFVDTFDVADPTIDPATRQPFVYNPNFNPGRIDILSVDPGLRLPSIHQYNFTVERQLGKQHTVSIGYNRTRGIGLLQNQVLNRARFPFNGFTQIDPNLGNTNPAPGFISEAQPRVVQRRPDARYNNVTHISNSSWSYYNAMRVEIKRRYSAGFHWQVSYAWSKTIDTGSDYTAGSAISEFDGPRTFRGLSDFDQRHRVNLNYSYLLPFFNAGRGWKRQALGGWTISGNNTFASGNPFTVTAGYDVNADGWSNDRPLLLDGQYFGSSVDNGRQASTGFISQQQLPLNAFYPNYTVPRASRLFDPGGAGLGTIGRNTFFGAGMKFWDLAVFKSFALWEKHKLTFRAEMYNVTNTPRFAFPDRSIQSPNFMRITSTYNPQNFVGASRSDDVSRIMQFALRYTF